MDPGRIGRRARWAGAPEPGPRLVRPAKAGGGVPQPYTYLSERFLPVLAASGVSPAEIELLTIQNPFEAFLGDGLQSPCGNVVVCNDMAPLTVPEAAKRAGRNPETVRRWIREGKLRSTKVGTQHLVDQQDLDVMTDEQDLTLPILAVWQQTSWGGPMPDVVQAVRRTRSGH